MMTDSEICNIYRLSKNKGEQIQIISELTLKSKEEVIRILTKGGQKVRIHVPGFKCNVDNLTDKDYVRLCTRRLDAIERKMSDLEKEYREVAAVIKGYAI